MGAWRWRTEPNAYVNGRLALAVVAADLVLSAAAVVVFAAVDEVAGSSVVGAAAVVLVDLAVVSWRWHEIRFGSLLVVLVRGFVAVAGIVNFVLPQKLGEESGLWVVGYLLGIAVAVTATLTCSAIVDRAVRSGRSSVWLGPLMRTTRR